MRGSGSLLAAAAVGLLAWNGQARGGVTFTVNSVADVADANPNDGACDTGSGTTCTLRAAIMQANQTSGAAVVLPDLGVPYVLVLGQIGITASMTITGAGASRTVVDGNMGGRILDVGPGITVALSGLTLRHAFVSGAQYGGAIFNAGMLTLTGCVVEESTAYSGGGIYSIQTLTLVESTVRACHAALSGGGLFNGSAMPEALELDRSLVAGSSAANGGGVYLAFGTATVTNSTISGNTSTESGGGLYAAPDATLKVFSSTITANQADSDLNGSGGGGGVSLASPGSRSFANTILADNEESVFCGPPFCDNVWIPTIGECAGTVASLGGVMLANYDTSHCTVTGAFTLNEPSLGPLQPNGGPTATHALLPGSPAVDHGTAGGCHDAFGALLPVDQRGAHRPTGAECDIGAYEYQANGDVNGDGQRSVADVFYLINFLFAGGPVPAGLGDVNGDAATNVSDVFYLINFLFAGGPAPL